MPETHPIIRLLRKMKTILIVDDSQLLVGTYGIVLRKEGYNVIESNSGVRGLELARKFQPDLIISDIQMPGGDGSTLLRSIRRDPELKSKQVVLMTGRPELVAPRKGMEDGADDFLIKPVGIEALKSCVEARFRRADISWRVEDRVLTQLRSMVSPQMPHEFFTPITGILGLLEVMRTNFAGAIPAEVQDIHGEIFQSVLRLQRTLRNYLLLLDLEDVHPVTLTEALSWRQVEESIVAGVKAVLQLNKRQEDIMVQVNECSVAVKPEDLVRIVEELVDNACKFSRQGTPITVEMESDGRLTVTDKGRGMTAEEVRSIGAFQQFDRKQHEQEGLGLGLVLVQKLAVKCHAKFLLSSDPGEGTRAQVTFLLYAQEYS